MLSILIPVHNFDITNLIIQLHQQLTATSICFEIIAMEDGSARFLEENDCIMQFDYCKHIILFQNIGRSAIRNRLADTARYENLLFIDCDSKLPPHFIEYYLPYLNQKKIILGGRIYNQASDKHHTLLPKYGSKERNTPKNVCKKNKNFSSPNFLIPKRIFRTIRFNEQIKRYGYEDFIFGIELKRHGYIFDFIDNPLIHINIEDNNLYIAKTEIAIQNLVALYNSGKYPEIETASTLIAVFLKIKKIHLIELFSTCFSIVKPLLLCNLKSPKPNLTLFNVYKISYLCYMTKKQDKDNRRK